MNYKKIIALLTLVYLSSFSCCFGMENVFYVLRNNAPARASAAQNAFKSLSNHFKLINILVLQSYSIDENGIVSGVPDLDVVDLARQHAIKIMPLITNTKFNKEIGHKFLLNAEAQKSAINTIIDICIKQHYYGVQFDFEMIGITDKDALTKFYQTAADALHKKGFAVSFAIAPVVSDNSFPSDFLKKIYENWEGAYDLKKLAKYGDFFSLMTYDQHGGGVTTPGPTASIQWVEAALKYALQYLPAQKISLGIPDYSSYWFTGTNDDGKIGVQAVGINHDKAMYLLQKYHVTPEWNDNDKVNYAVYEHDWLNEYLFIEDDKSFAAKLALVKKYNLRGISVFDLGTEDSRIWDVLSNHNIL